MDFHSNIYYIRLTRYEFRKKRNTSAFFYIKKEEGEITSASPLQAFYKDHFNL